ncbi:MAG: hypothetical protein ACLP50_19955, partial [Solirubrobacteraceae bacterium]
MSSSQPTAGPPLGLVLTSLFRADFVVMVRNRRSLLLSILLPVFILLVTNSSQATHNFGGALFTVGLAIAYGLVSAS